MMNMMNKDTESHKPKFKVRRLDNGKLSLIRYCPHCEKLQQEIERLTQALEVKTRQLRPFLEL